MPKIQKPILRGFNPDPSIVRVGDDYYIATSTFEWFPDLYISTDENIGKHIRVMTSHPELPDMFTAPIPIFLNIRSERFV